MSKPILISIEGESQRLVVNKAGAGIAVKPEDPEDLAKRILFLMQNQNKAISLGEHGRKYVEAHFSRNKLADDYLHQIKLLLHES